MDKQLFAMLSESDSNNFETVSDGIKTDIDDNKQTSDTEDVQHICELLAKGESFKPENLSAEMVAKLYSMCRSQQDLEPTTSTKTVQAANRKEQSADSGKAMEPSSRPVLEKRTRKPEVRETASKKRTQEGRESKHHQTQEVREPVPKKRKAGHKTPRLSTTVEKIRYELTNSDITVKDNRILLNYKSRINTKYIVLIRTLYSKLDYPKLVPAYIENCQVVFSYDASTNRNCLVITLQPIKGELVLEPDVTIAHIIDENPNCAVKPGPLMSKLIEEDSIIKSNYRISLKKQQPCSFILNKRVNDYGSLIPCYNTDFLVYTSLNVDGKVILSILPYENYILEAKVPLININYD